MHVTRVLQKKQKSYIFHVRRFLGCGKEPREYLLWLGNYNQGEDPLNIAKKYPRLHVIGMSADNDADKDIETCRQIAKAGQGKFYAVLDYKEIPRALMDLLFQT